MKKTITFLLLIFLLSSCFKKKDKVSSETKKINCVLPFTNVELDNMSDFEEASQNWKTKGSVYADRSKAKSLISSEGTGILLNLPNEQNNGNLFTTFQHGDIELEVDVMMPKGSNSGLYFQGRYEVQLLDSWGVKEPQHSDMGGIYHRWDDTRGEGNEGFEGFAPKINAAKAPGLWQHFKIIFHAPKFDDLGKKIKNAEFEEVWLNGMLVQKNIEVTGPTRAAAFEDEQPEAPLMVQGDHGPVAFKNFKYKLYGDKKVTLADITMIEFENDAVMLPNFDTLKLIREIQTDSISATMTNEIKSARILSYTGNLVIPESGDYLFDLRFNNAGGVFIIKHDTLINLNGLYIMDDLGFGKKNLKKGNVPFQFIYNKHLFWKKGFVLMVEGPGIQNHALHAPSSIKASDFEPQESILIEVSDEVLLHRSFWMHGGTKRTHCISVGTPQGIHFVYDLSNGALLQVWNGDFVDAAQMWLGRGEKQLSEPAGFTISLHGDPEFLTLTDKDMLWPKEAIAIKDFKALGYTLDGNGAPTFNYQIGNTVIADKMTPGSGIRSMKRAITIKGATAFYHKIAEGKSIEKLPDGTFIVNDESYFINFSEASTFKPYVRENNGKEEMIIHIPDGDYTLNYTITW